MRRACSREKTSDLTPAVCEDRTVCSLVWTLILGIQFSKGTSQYHKDGVSIPSHVPIKTGGEELVLAFTPADVQHRSSMLKLLE